MNNRIALAFAFVFGMLLAGGVVEAASGPAPFDCPWTAVPSGTTNPSAGGNYGGSASGP